MKYLLLPICSLVVVFFFYFIIQTKGSFTYSYKAELDPNPMKGTYPVQSIVYSPLFGSEIISGGKGKMIKTSESPFLKFSEKTPFFKEAIQEKIDLPLRIGIPFSFILFWIMKRRKENQN